MADVIRVIILALTLFNIGSMVSVIFRHVQAWRVCPKSRSLKIRHVIGVSAAQAFLLLGVGFAYLDGLRRGESDLSPRAAFYLIANLLTFFAMVDISRYMKKAAPEKTGS